MWKQTKPKTTNTYVRKTAKTKFFEFSIFFSDLKKMRKKNFALRTWHFWSDTYVCLPVNSSTCDRCPTWLWFLPGRFAAWHTSAARRFRAWWILLRQPFLFVFGFAVFQSLKKTFRFLVFFALPQKMSRRHTNGSAWIWQRASHWKQYGLLQTNG